ncbi:transglycosylase domain-containing protein [Lapillicoccus jejuensis]|uniref:Membrane peptidoglycan carboxypeptidase n=1 Tax=Lapillicoccus jejuensis TaxID=402171 RepID=A0A542DXW0_9MICO|nr:transglycosylase domain-containing protein [Lapillicoccus jejuensis]TQJ07921.1 membrane peptidoglycan carboxypeptidase [Lapillicoccus jejuensis]
MRAGRTTNIASVIKLLGAFVATSMVLGLLVAGVAMPAVGAAGQVARSGIDVFDSLPDSFTAAPLSQQSRIVAYDGSLLSTPYDENRVIVPLSAVSPIMRKAQVAIEDSRFYEHGGMDMRGVVRAVVSNAQGDVVQGGSTLTQQYVKQLLTETALQNGDTAAAASAQARSGLAGLTRKLQELKYSIELEKRLSKDQILQGYLNIVYYGDQAYGVEAASQHYFGHPASKLTLVEAATLAGLTQNPGTTDPVHYPAKAQARRNVVLDRMLELGVITQKDHDVAKSTPIAKTLRVTSPRSSCAGAGQFAYFCQYALAYLLKSPEMAVLGKTQKEREEKIYNGGLTIKTTLNPALAQVMKQQIEARVPEANDVRGIHIGSAGVTLDPNTGAVQGIAQNTTYTTASQTWDKTSVNWSVDQMYGGSGGFQFGSTEKAFALVTALEAGLPINTRVQAREAGPGKPTFYTSKEFPGGDDQCGLAGRAPWSVKNEANGEGGNLTLSQATAKSVNTAFVALVQQLGACKVRDTEVKLGLHKANGQPIPQNPPAIILGAAEVSPMTVANAYGVMAAGGKLCTASPISSITDANGKAIKVPQLGKDNCKQVVEPDIAAGVAAIMKATLASGGTASTSALAGGRPAAGKTGTSDGNNETWFVGYTPQLVTAVWTGTPLENSSVLDNITLAGQFYRVVYGSAISAPIWKGIMDYALQNQPATDFPAPSAVIANGNIQPFSPSPIGYSVANATAILQSQGFQVQVGGTIASNYRPGVVAGTLPRGSAPVGSTVTLLTSSGPAPRTQTQQQPPAGGAGGGGGAGNTGPGGGQGNGGPGGGNGGGAAGGATGTPPGQG